ncbi:hypothetical protein FSST1_000035 [Fusarium sambucinum]
MPLEKADLSGLAALLKAYLAHKEPGTTSARYATQKDIDAALGSPDLITEGAVEGQWLTEVSPSTSSSSVAAAAATTTTSSSTSSSPS